MDKNNILNKYKGIIVVDNFGAGKTTIIKEILKENENYIYLGDMFQVSEIRLRQVIDGGRFIFMEHTRLSEKEVDRFKRKGFFIGSIDEVKKIMKGNDVNNENDLEPIENIFNWWIMNIKILNKINDFIDRYFHFIFIVGIFYIPILANFLFGIIGMVLSMCFNFFIILSILVMNRHIKQK